RGGEVPGRQGEPARVLRRPGDEGAQGQGKPRGAQRAFQEEARAVKARRPAGRLLACEGMRIASPFALALLLAACKSHPTPKPRTGERALPPGSKVDEADAFVQALREEYQALGRIQAVLRWYSSTQGETALTQLTYVGHDRLFRKTALDALALAQQKPDLP